MSILKSFRDGFSAIGAGMASIAEGMGSLFSATASRSDYSNFRLTPNNFQTHRSFTYTKNGKTIQLTDDEMDDETRKMMDEAFEGFEADMATAFTGMDNMFDAMNSSMDNMRKRADEMAKRAEKAATKRG